jgi:hypothetical protein
MATERPQLVDHWKIDRQTGRDTNRQIDRYIERERERGGTTRNREKDIDGGVKHKFKYHLVIS